MSTTCLTSSSADPAPPTTSPSLVLADGHEDEVSKTEEEKKSAKLTEQCRVCDAPADHHVHYGAICCPSCRAFFRRSVQSDVDFVCKSKAAGKCTLRRRSKLRACQRCRFDRCLNVGMRSSYVLTKDQRDKRLRQTRDKNEKKQTDNAAMAQNGKSDSKELQLLAAPSSVPISEEEVGAIKAVALQHDINYKSVPFGEELIKEMVMCSVLGLPMSTAASMTAYRLMIQRVTKVAHGFDRFLDLAHDTQSALLKQNADLLVSLRGAVFFDDRKKGLDQLLFSMGVDDIEVGKKMIVATLRSAGHLSRIGYRSFNSIQQISADSADERRYDRLLARVGASVAAHPHYVKLLSYVLLFSADFTNGITGKERASVEAVQDTILNMLRRFIFSQYTRRSAVTLFANIVACVSDLRELVQIKQNRLLAAKAVEQPGSSYKV